jgi:erythritol kinase (D-erythritol 1-phosphate-forming)
MGSKLHDLSFRSSRASGAPPMTRDILLGIDAGTSVIKSVAFSLAGEQVAVAARPNVYQTLGGGQVEQDMARTWADCAATLRELGERIPNLSRRVAALAVTAQGDGSWLIDAAGEPVGGGLLWLDSRAASLVSDYLRTDAYRDHYARTGSGLNACMASGQLAWMKRWQPERIARAATCFHCKDWLYFKLTGDRVTCPAEGIFTFGNYRTRKYEPSILEGMGIADCERLLTPMIEGAEEAGSLSAAAAAATGLRQGTPVSLGYIDVVCVAAGSGIHDPSRDLGVSVMGSTGMHMRYAPTPDDVRLNDDRSGYTMCFPSDYACSSMQSNLAATLNIDWLMDLAREAAAMAGAETSRQDLLRGLDEKVLSARPGQAIYHPYIFEAGERGPFLDPDARAQFSGLSVKTSFAGMVRAVFEGLAFATRDCYLASGAMPSEVRLGGGAARSKAMRAILAAALDTRVRTLSREELGAAGAAMMAAVNIGGYANMGDCAKAWVTPSLGEVTIPDPDLVRFYSKLYPVYRTIRAAMAPAWASLGRIRKEYAA